MHPGHCYGGGASAGCAATGAAIGEGTVWVDAFCECLGMLTSLV